MHFSFLFQFCPVCGSSNFLTNNEKSKRCTQCNFTYYINPSAAVAAFIENEQGELLVCRRAKEPAKDTLDLPGGFVDAHETAHEALSREIQEELNVSLLASEYLFSLPNEYEYSGLTVPTLDLFFRVSLPQHSALIPSDDVAECFFVSKKNLHPEDFGLKSIRKAIENYLAQAN